MEDLESAEFKVHDPRVSWLSGKDHPFRPARLSVSVSLTLLCLCLSESEVVLRTREGHVLSFSLGSNLTTTLLDNSSLVSYSGRRRRAELGIDRLVTADSGTNPAAGGAGDASRLRGRSRSSLLSREPKKELGGATVSAHFPPQSGCFVCCQHERSKRNLPSRSIRLNTASATLTVLCGSSVRSVQRGCVGRLR